MRMFARIAFQILFFVSCDLLSDRFSLLDPSFGPPQALFSVRSVRFSLLDRSFGTPEALFSALWPLL